MKQVQKMLDESDGTSIVAPVKLQLLHSTRKRARLRIDSRFAPEELSDLANRLASVPGVLHAQIRPNTGSVILDGHTDINEVLEKVADRKIAVIGKPPNKPPVDQVLQMGLLRADVGVKKQTGDVLDLRTLMSLVLIGAAIVQLGRGRIAGPATTLALGALSLIDKKSGRS